MQFERITWESGKELILDQFPMPINTDQNYEIDQKSGSMDNTFM